MSVAKAELPARNGGRVLVDQLLISGVDRIFCVPGESFLPVLDALRDVRDRIGLTVCRHEASVSNMADAYGKLTGRPGIGLVTRGPGATHASVGLHTAFQDSTPLILLVGQLQRAHLGREGFQEIDVHATFGGLAKWVVQIDDPLRIPEMIRRAFTVALSGRPGPVVVAVPEDVLDEVCQVADVPASRPSRAHPGRDEIEQLRSMLAAASRPLLLVGGGAWSEETSDAVEGFAARNDLPVVATFRRQDHLDNRSEQYVGYLGLATNPALGQRVRDSDLIIVLGARLGDATTGGYSLVKSPVPDQRLIHIHPDPGELDTVFAADLPINSGVAEFAAAAAHLEQVDSSAWGAWRKAARDDYLAHLQPEPSDDKLDLGKIMVMVRDRLPRNAIIANGAGNYTVWLHRHLQFSHVRTQLAPTSGAMGYGVPAAIAAKAVLPDRTVVAFAGDGCFLMSGQELATAVQYDLAVILIVINNGMLATIRMHQERRFPGRAYGVDLVNPDFAALARAFGAQGEVVEVTQDFPAAFERALAAGGPALIELRTEPRQLTPTLRINHV